MKKCRIRGNHDDPEQHYWLSILQFLLLLNSCNSFFLAPRPDWNQPYPNRRKPSHKAIVTRV
jgi:hypothetical protein